MKTSSQNIETNNLVLFPSAKNYTQDLDLDDPMFDLLNEYAHMSDADIPAYLDDEYQRQLEESDLEDETAFGSLEAFMARNQHTEVLSPDEKLLQLINDRMQAIHEAKARIKFYLEEIEMFLPRRR